MHNQSELPQDISMQQIMRIAASPAGQQLLSLLQRQGGDDFRAAMDSAAAGNYDQVKRSLSSLLSTPEAQELLKQLGR